jgi:hypothetical protein
MMAPTWALWRSSQELVFPARSFDTTRAAPLGGAQPNEARNLSNNKILSYAKAARSGTFSKPVDFAAMIFPTKEQFPSMHHWVDWGSGSSEAFIYLGLWPWALGLLGLCMGTDELKKMWLFVMSAFFLLMLGPSGGLHLIIFDIFPLFRLVRHTHIYACFFEFSFLYFYVLGLNCAFDSLGVSSRDNRSQWRETLASPSEVVEAP